MFEMLALHRPVEYKNGHLSLVFDMRSKQPWLAKSHIINQSQIG